MTRRSGSERIHEALRNSERYRVHELSCTVFSFSSGTRAIGSIAVILAETVGGQLSVRPVAAAQTVVLLPVFGKRSGNTP